MAMQTRTFARGCGCDVTITMNKLIGGAVNLHLYYETHPASRDAQQLGWRGWDGEGMGAYLHYGVDAGRPGSACARGCAGGHALAGDFRKCRCDEFDKELHQNVCWCEVCTSRGAV